MLNTHDGGLSTGGRRPDALLQGASSQRQCTTAGNLVRKGRVPSKAEAENAAHVSVSALNLNMSFSPESGGLKP